MRPVYLICHRDRPWAVLFSASDLEQEAQSLAAQTNADELHVYASDSGSSRELTVDESASLRSYLSASA